MSIQSNLVDDDNESYVSFSLKESSHMPQLFCKNGDSSLMNQTLEKIFAGLSMSTSLLDQQPHLNYYCNGSSSLGGASSGVSLNGKGSHSHQSSNLARNNINGAANIGEKLSWNSSLMGCERDSRTLKGSWAGSYPTTSANGYSYYPLSCDGFLDSESLLMQREFGNGFSSVPLSNSGGDEIRENSHGGFLNGTLGDRLNFPLFHVNARPPHGYQGGLLSIAKDQRGSKILQEAMKTMTAREVSSFFSRMIGYATELMVDQCGNHVFQRLVEICSEEQRTQIIYTLTEPYLLLFRICLNQHGARSVEKLLEHVTTEEQRALIMLALNPATVALAKDTNGHRVVVRCVKHFPAKDTEYLLKKVINNCFGIAIDKTGCCVLQQCVIYAQGEIKKQLIADIILNASFLAEDCYGNYIVQHLFSLKVPEVAEGLLRQLEGNFLSLSLNKYGSNVVERFFHDMDERLSVRIIWELLLDPNVVKLLVDPYGNYVIKSALLVSKGDVRSTLLKLIQVNFGIMRSNHYGKKLLDRLDKERIWRA